MRAVYEDFHISLLDIKTLFHRLTPALRSFSGNGNVPRGRRRYPPKVSSLRDESASAGGHDIPRRLIRNNKTHLGAPPLFVWNHQLLPNFQNKRHPPYFSSLRRDLYPAGARKPAAKRSNLAWVCTVAI